MSDNSSTIPRNKSEEELMHATAQGSVKMTEAAVERLETLVNRTADARKALDLLTETWKNEWFDFDDKSKTYLNDFRMWRMAMEREMNQLLAACGDVRKFFLSDVHDKEVERLKEFVLLCERLQKLKDSGFLDQVADTILRLEKP